MPKFPFQADTDFPKQMNALNKADAKLFTKPKLQQNKPDFSKPKQISEKYKSRSICISSLRRKIT